MYAFDYEMTEGKVVNVVASLKLSCPLDLNRIQETQKVCSRLRSNALTVKLERSPITSRIFKSGNIVLLGGKSEKQVFLLARRLVRLLRKLGFNDCSISGFNITNVVASFNMSCELDLNRFARDNITTSTWDIDIFPGLKYTFGDRKTSKQTATIFIQGKLYVAGFTTEKKALHSLKQLIEILKHYKKQYVNNNNQTIV